MMLPQLLIWRSMVALHWSAVRTAAYTREFKADVGQQNRPQEGNARRAKPLLGQAASADLIGGPADGTKKEATHDSRLRRILECSL